MSSNRKTSNDGKLDSLKDSIQEVETAIYSSFKSAVTEKKSKQTKAINREVQSINDSQYRLVTFVETKLTTLENFGSVIDENDESAQIISKLLQDVMKDVQSIKESTENVTKWASQHENAAKKEFQSLTNHS